jgi:hypothetical protein
VQTEVFAGDMLLSNTRALARIHHVSREELYNLLFSRLLFFGSSLWEDTWELLFKTACCLCWTSQVVDICAHFSVGYGAGV